MATTNDARAVAVDAAGDVVVSGITELFKLSGADGNEIWRAAGGSGVVALDAGDVFTADASGFDRWAGANGANVWHHTLPFGVMARAVAIDPAGDVIGGADNLFSDPSNPEPGILKLRRSDGATLWSSEAGLAAEGVAVDGAGDVVAGSGDVHKLRGSDGTTLWRSANSAFGGVGVDAGGDVFASPNPNSDVQPFSVVRLSGADGSELWRRDINGTGLGQARVDAGALDGSGNVVAAGRVFNAATGAAFTVVKLAAADGSELWRYELDTALTDEAFGVAVDGAGDVVAVGSAPSDNAFTVVKLDGGSGAELWRVQPVSGDAGAVAVDAFGDVVAAGRKGSNDMGFEFFAVKLSGASGADYLAVCGNGLQEAGEQCDDGNLLSCDGCSPLCRTEVGFLCGDGVVNTACGEQCDDGNQVDGDGCSATCQEQSAPESVSCSSCSSATTDEGAGATPSDPVETSVTSPTPGSISISEGPVTTPPPMGFQILAQAISITAPAASISSPLVLTFQLDVSRIPAGQNENTLAVLKDGVPVPTCTGAPGTASPDPCVSSRARLGDGDVSITILTSTASLWNLAIDLCGAVPAVGCRQAGKASLLLKNSTDNTLDSLTWKWLEGAPSPKEAFGQPLTSTNYVFCVYDANGGTPLPKLRLAALGGGTCTGKPCWSESATGFKYKNSALSPDGRLQLVLHGSPEPGGPKILVKGKGSGLALPGLPFAQDPTVTAQLTNGAACWQARFDPPASKNEAGQFSDKSK